VPVQAPETEQVKHVAKKDVSDGSPRDERSEESQGERLSRNTTDLLSELRVAATGIQVLFAFLLIVPFNAGWRRVSSFDRYDYFVTLMFVATAAALLMAPPIHHRLLFRRGERAYLLRTGTRFAIVAMVCLSVGLTGILLLIAHVMFGAATAVAVGVLAACGLGGLWFGLPLRRRRHCRQGDTV
jgi:Family of unknown function (DUF6328)